MYTVPKYCAMYGSYSTVLLSRIVLRYWFNRKIGRLVHGCRSLCDGITPIRRSHVWSSCQTAPIYQPNDALYPLLKQPSLNATVVNSPFGFHRLIIADLVITFQADRRDSEVMSEPVRRRVPILVRTRPVPWLHAFLRGLTLSFGVWKSELCYW